MMKFLEYILKRGGKVKMEAIPAATENFANIQNCFEQIFEQDVEKAKGIYKLVNTSFDEEDWVTWHFMQWFVKE